jgi:hypothetical protein
MARVQRVIAMFREFTVARLLTCGDKTKEGTTKP